MVSKAKSSCWCGCRAAENKDGNIDDDAESLVAAKNSSTAWISFPSMIVLSACWNSGCSNTLRRSFRSAWIRRISLWIALTSCDPIDLPLLEHIAPLPNVGVLGRIIFCSTPEPKHLRAKKLFSECDSANRCQL